MRGGSRRVDGYEPRYWLLESSREYAREKLAALRETEPISRSHALAYLAVAEQLEVDYDTAPDAKWFAQAQAELANWQVALEWSFAIDRNHSRRRR